jgi:hypothetical protein
VVEQNNKLLPVHFQTFSEAESFVKRQYSAALTRDDQYAEYIRNKKKS